MKKQQLFLFIILILSNLMVSAQTKAPALGQDKIEDVIASLTLEEKNISFDGFGR